MPTIPEHVLVHRARVVRVARDENAPKDFLGERPTLAPDEGAWFPARIMSQRPSEDAADGSGRRRASTGWTLLYGDEFEDGTDLTSDLMPGASDMVDVDVEGVVTRYVATRPRFLDRGLGPFGGEVDLVEVGDAS